jgi:hypothetical protein
VYDNENHILLCPEFFKITALQEGHILINAENKTFKECIVYDDSVASYCRIPLKSDQGT